MSVTFTAEITGTADLRQFDVKCEDGQTIGRYTGYSLAYSEAQAHGLVCTNDLCQDYGADVDEVHDESSPEGVNMLNRTGRTILAILGLLEDDLSGSVDARRFVDLVGSALAIGVHDPALDALDVYGAGFLGTRFEGRTIDFGQEAGHVTGKLRALLTLGEACLRLGVRVTWG